MAIEVTAKFTGDKADEHLLPAFEAGQSLHGLSRGFAMTGHYLATGTVRQRYPFKSGIEVYMAPPRAGSFETVFQLQAHPELVIFGGVVGTIGAGIAANFATDFIRHIYRKATGQTSNIQTEVIEEIDEERPGDIDALVEAVEPALKMAHTTIGAGAENIIIVGGRNNVVNFSGRTKNYINYSEQDDNAVTQDLSVGSYNVNSRNGRAFFHNLGRTIPFTVVKDCKPGTVQAITHSINQYANQLPSDIEVKFFRILAGDGSLKRIHIVEAKSIEEE